MYVIPISVFFQKSLVEVCGSSILVLILSCFVFLDAIFDLNSEFYEKGKIVSNRVVILEKYVNRRLIYDLFVLIPLMTNACF
jgi:hypothetical protein